MRQSQLFTKTLKNPPKDEVSLNAKLLIRSSFVDKLMAGVYTYLPLGFRVLKKIEGIIREEMERAGGVELLMPSFQPKENWMKTGRWETMDDLYKVTDGSKREFALGPTHEEVVVPLVKNFISSYKDLPLYVFQIQNKFRMELRAKSGLLRGREFMMKDLYSFHTDEEDMQKYYEEIKENYHNIFKVCGIGEKTYITFASGGAFSKYSHEFQTVTDAGEDIIHLCEKCELAVNAEIIDEQKICPKCEGKDFVEKKAIEVGNIFPLKTKFSDAFDLVYKNKEGKDNKIIMGCYGIGLGRLMGAIAEVHHDDRGIIWPRSVAPYLAHLLVLGHDQETKKHGDDLYKELEEAGIEMLYDDRDDVSVGEKFADADLIGIPYRIVVSGKTMKVGKYEVKKRNSEEIKMMKKEELFEVLDKG